MIRVLAPLPVLLPLLGAAMTLIVGRHARLQRTVSIAILTAVFGVTLALVFVADDLGATAIDVGGWPAPIGITIVVDRLAALMLLISATVTLGVLVYAVGQGTADGDDETPLSIFHPTYLVLSAGVAYAFLAGDLFNLYVGFEVLLVASYVLLTLGGTAPRINAGVIYIIVSLVSSVIFLAGIALVYAATGTLNMAQLSVRLAELPEGVQTVLQVMLLVAFGIKAAVFPLSSWLPDSYPTAPAPVTAVFAGLLTKVGVYAIIRTQTLLFPNGGVDDLLMVVALATMIIGILGAVAQSDIKRMLSFTLVSHIGYMVFGIALATDRGLSGAVFYVAHHITIQTALFLSTGLVERQGGSTSINRLGGLAKAAPLLAILFFVPAMNLAGIPPLSGFIGKVGLLEAGVIDGGALSYALVAGGVLTSLLTLLAVAKVWGKAFWQPLEQAPALVTLGSEARDESVIETASATTDQTPGTANASAPASAPTDSNQRLPRTMLGATAALVVAGLALTVFGGPLYAYTDRAAVDLRERTPYIEAVFGGEVP